MAEIVIVADLVEVELHAEVHDDAIWEGVKQKLDGLRIFPGDELVTEALSIVEKKAKEQIQEAEKKLLSVSQDLATANQQLSFTKAELEQKNQSIAHMKSELSRLRRIEAELEELSGLGAK